MVEGVEERRAKFEGISFSEPECALDGKVPVGQTGRDDGVARAIPKRTGSFRRKCARQHVRLREISELIANRPDAIRPLVEVIRTAAAICTEDRSSEPVTEGRGTRNLPVLQEIHE